MTIALVRVVDTPPVGFDPLRAAALSDGYRRVERLAENWASGTERFDASGENLLAAFITGDLAGIGGMTVDRQIVRALRMRRFYVRRASLYVRRIASEWRGTLPGRSIDCEGTPARTMRGGERPDRGGRAIWEELGFVRDRCDGHMHMRLARRWSDCASTLPQLSGRGEWSGVSGQMRIVRQHAHRRAPRIVRSDHRPCRLRRLLRQRREARPAGTCGEAGHRRRRRARRGHGRLLHRPHLRRAQRHADVQGAEGLPGRGGDPPGLRQIRRRRRGRSAR